MTWAANRSGFALLEAVLASVVFALAALSTFKCIQVASRCAHDQAQYLRADAAAFDIAWAHYHRAYDELLAECEAAERKPEAISRTAVEGLTGGVATVRVTRSRAASADRSESLVITVTVEWGGDDRRRQRQLCIVRTNLEKEWT